MSILVRKLQLDQIYYSQETTILYVKQIKLKYLKLLKEIK